MNPSGQEPSDVNPIADQNTERLLAGAYRPEAPDPAFISQVTAAMQAAAAERAQPAPLVPGFRSRSTVKRWIGWVAAAGLLLSFGAVAGTMLRTRPGFQQQDGTVWIDGKAYRETDVVPQDHFDRSRELSDSLRADLGGGTVHLSSGSLPEEPVTEAVTRQGVGSFARPQRAATAASADLLQVGRSAETGKDQRRRLALADGSILYLNRDTGVTLTAPREVTLLRGEIYVEVAQDPAAARFIVSTPRRQLIALGTKFDVRVAPEGTELLVTQGKVQVSDLQLPVTAGQQLVLDRSTAGPPDIAAAPRATHAIEWTRELMAAAQSPLVPGSRYSGGSLVAVDPQGQETRLSLRKYRVDVHIEDGFARTTIDQTYFNHESARLEGTFYFPLPPDASLSRLAMYVNGRLMEGGMAERQHAREVFESIVYRMKDPALLEWVDGSTFKMRVFPLEGRQEKRIILSYTQRLRSLYGQSEYRFPGGHSLPVIGDWSAHVCIKRGARSGERGAGSTEYGVLSTEYGVECEPRFTVTTRDGDLLLDAAAKDIRPDRDIVMRIRDTSDAGDAKPLPDGEGTSSAPRSPLPAPCFSSAVSEGSKYLMLRWRPELPGEKVRQRRDWIFLFESSGDRDPLLARAQVEIVKTILDNAEHDDTFSILTAATRVTAYEPKPQTATPANVKQAVRFLENVHLVGALDLGRVFEAARPLAEAAQNPVLVHVGSGLPVLGLRDSEALIKRLPERTAYVGIGVGNRWSRALMKSAAARSGGYFTQINPDEQIAWRALDVLATLNTPRLLDIRINGVAMASVSHGRVGGARKSGIDGALREPVQSNETRYQGSDSVRNPPLPQRFAPRTLQVDALAGQPGKADVRFLTCEDSLAQGEQLCAIARLDAAAELPKAVEITGTLGGKPRRWTLSVAGVAEQADYLPRTWAKLEIDRLVADGAEKNKARVIELSKAMYVMSPFTSLLVLENEEMYAQYHVDRGRKDHWAMYDCPEQIPVVFEPIVGPPGPSGKAEAKGPTAEEVLSTVLVQVPPAILGPPGERCDGVLTLPIVAVSWSCDPLFDARFRPQGGLNVELYNPWAEAGATAIGLLPFLGAGSSRSPTDPLRDLPMFIRPEETQTGRLMFGVGVNSDAGLVGNITLDEDASVAAAVTWLSHHQLTEGRWNLRAYRNADGGWRYDPSSDPGSVTGWQIMLSETVRDRLQTQQRLAELVDQYNRLNDEQRFAEAEVIAKRAHELAPHEMVTQVMVSKSSIVLKLDRERRFKDRKEDGFANAMIDVSEAAKDKAIDTYTTSFANLEAESKKNFTAFGGGLQATQTESTRTIQTVASIKKAADEEKSKAEDSTKAAAKAVQQKEEEIRKLTAIREKLNRPEMDVPSGEITWVSQPNKLVWINRGRADALQRQTRFTVYSDDSANAAKAVKKGTVEVTRIEGDHVAQARILDDKTDDPIMAGDKVFAPFGSPSQQNHFAVTGILRGYDRQLPTFEPPVFSNNPAVFYDLVSYAPAMHTNLVDVLTVLEAEAPVDAAAARPGKVDDRARRLIERARGTGWQTATIADPHGKTPLTVAFDGTGRYRYERTTSAGLRELVVCDGTSLWHLYPDLGIGARRTLNRFHRQDLARLVPWALPPVEDLARGADLVCVDERTVAIVPQELEGRPKGGTASAQSRRVGQDRAASAGPPMIESSAIGGPALARARLSHPTVRPQAGERQAARASLRTNLVFAPDGRLAERQLVEMPSGKIRIRESYGADATVELVDYETKNAGGTPAPQRKIQLAPCGAPELKPDAALVVLPLPLRSRQQVLESRKLLGNENFGSWTEDDALAVIAADLGEYPAEMKQIIGQRFFRRGDRRLGFYTLLLSTGQTWNPKEKQAFQGGDPLPLDPLADHPKDPLAKYVAAYLVSSQPGGPKDLGDPAETGARDSSFFRQLAEFHDLWDRWHDGRATEGDESQRHQERQRALAFIERAQSPEFAWGLLMAVRGALSHGDFNNTFVAAIPRFETVPGLQYAARYERARASLFAGGGDSAHGRDLFCKLFTETLEAGIVPPIDGDFREVLSQGGHDQQWQTIIHAAAKKLIDAGARPSAVYLARQVRQVGDPPLAEEVFDMALRDAPERERLGLTLARIDHCRQTGQLPRADALLQPLLNDNRYGDSPALWYLAEAIADARGMTARAIGFRQRALDIEFEHLPEKVNVELIRADYGQLLARYEKLATAIGPLHEAAPRELMADVIRAADRWRQLDPDPTAACQAAARILGELGETDQAWDYLTTPLAIQPNEAAGWANLARTLRQQGHVDLADRAYAAAFDAEPTNAQILWDRAELLQENGRPDQARPLFRQIAAGPWGPQFSALQGRAKQYAGK